MKNLIATALTGLISALIALSPIAVKPAQASYDAAWDFTCDWECGEAHFESEYGGYTVNGYAAEYHEELPSSEWEASAWAYDDYFAPAGCEALSTEFSQMVCFDTAYLRGVGGWQELAANYQGYGDDELACAVMRDRAYLHNDGSAYAEGWLNRDYALMDVGGCS
jgi:hypothetical protein